MKDVTGPISIGLTTGNDGTEALADVPGIVRNISFSNIRASVVKPVTPPYAEGSDFRPAEFFSCITLEECLKSKDNNIICDFFFCE